MIVELAETACRQLDELDALEIAKKEAGDINAPLKELAEVKSKAVQLTELCLLLSDRLPLTEIQSIEIPRILQKVQASRTKFTQGRERRQVLPLRDIATTLQTLIVKVEGLWKKYAESLVNPHFDLMELVRLLPEMRTHEATLRGLKTQLQRHITILPQTRAELDDFDEQLNQLRSRLANLENLHPEVRSFLRKAHQNQATIADLTDEVMRWCRQGEHARVFRIGFLS
jgi:RNA processing factor Prp31